MLGVFGLKFLSSVLALSSQCSLKGAICPYLSVMRVVKFVS